MIILHPRTALSLLPGLLLLLGCQEGVALHAVPLAASDSGQDSAAACGQITGVGCCQGPNLVYCGGGKLVTRTCKPPLTCGWQASYGLYGCGNGSSADPSGIYPRACPAPDAAAGDLGAVPDAAAADSAGPGPDLGGCGASVTFTGCCHKDQLFYCAGGKILRLDCSSRPKCGWNAGGGFYDCATAGKADPGGKHPLSCGGLPWDGGPGEAGPADLGGDATGGDGPARDLTLDSGRPQEAGQAEDQAPPSPEAGGDARGPETSGLDVTGLEGGAGDSGDGASGGGGCSCEVAAGRPGGQPAATLSLVPVLLLLALGTRRRSAR